MILTTRTPTLLLAVSLGLGCTPAPAPPDPPADAGAPDAYLPAATYCEEIATFFCPFYLRCGRLVADDLEQCLAIFAESCEAGFEPEYVQLETAGLMRFSRAGRDACAAHLEDVPCTLQPRDLDGPCAQLWEGQQAAGEPCGFNLESLTCAPETECALSLDLCGECRSIVDVGEPCGAGVEPAVSCGPSADCEGGACVARVPLLEACGQADRCVRGAFCIDGACVGPSYVELGQPCGQVDRCPFNAHCEAGLCQLDALQGESCANTGCASGDCVDATCVAPPPPDAPSACYDPLANR